MKNNSALFFTCSLIEYIGRETKQKRRTVVSLLGDAIRRIYEYADVLHCEPIAKVADEWIAICNIPEGDFDNVAACKYEAPDYWTIGEVYERLIEDVAGEDILVSLGEVYTSWMDERLSDYNTDLFYQPRDYLKECYLAGEIL